MVDRKFLFPSGQVREAFSFPISILDFFYG